MLISTMDKNPIPLLPNNNPVPPPPSEDRKKYTRREFVDMESGRAPPQAVDLEQVILGALMIDKKGVDEVIQILKPEFFYVDDHKIIFEAIQNLYDKNTGIDLLTVSEELKRIAKLGFIGGDFYLISLTQKVSSSAHIEFHSRIVIQKYVLRRLIAKAHDTIEDSYYHDPDIFDIMDSITADIESINSNVIQGVHSEATDAKKELYDKVQSVKDGEPPGVYSGIDEFDEWSGGFQKRELITLAARPGMGKTTAMLAIAGNASFKKNIPIAFFSLEMAVADLKARLAARGTAIAYDKIRLGKLDAFELNKVLNYYDFIDESCLHLIERTNTLSAIKKRIRELVKKHGIKMAMIDYVQLMKLTNSSGDRTSDLSTITRDLKALANELNIPIIILAQLNRSVDDRPSKRPKLSDLKQSGSIEEDSDTVIFLLRSAYYEQSTGTLLPPHIVGKTEFIVAKGRNTGTRDFWTFLDFINYDFRSY